MHSVDTRNDGQAVRNQDDWSAFELTGRPKPKVLYVSYTGMLEPLGSSQVLAYMMELRADARIVLVSFERAADIANQEALHGVREKLRSSGIAWHFLRYHKRPPVLATLWDVLRGIYTGWRLAREEKFAIVHARSYVAALIGLALKKFLGAKLIFDMRGFWFDERVDGNLWKKDGYLYRTGKKIEKVLIRESDQLVSLTLAGAKEIRRWPAAQSPEVPIAVISTCADLKRFSLPSTTRPRRPLTIGYVGSAGTWYHFEHAATAFSILARLDPDARILIINRREHDLIRSALIRAGVPESRFQIISASHDQMPQLLQSMHGAIFFIRPLYSKIASAPTKLGELLGCGVPCLSNTGVGDMEQVLDADKVGVTVDAFDDQSLVDGVNRFHALTKESDIAHRCANSAQMHFSLESGVAAYRSIYKRLTIE